MAEFEQFGGPAPATEQLHRLGRSKHAEPRLHSLVAKAGTLKIGIDQMLLPVTDPKGKRKRGGKAKKRGRRMQKGSAAPEKMAMWPWIKPSRVLEALLQASQMRSLLGDHGCEKFWQEAKQEDWAKNHPAYLQPDKSVLPSSSSASASAASSSSSS